MEESVFESMKAAVEFVDILDQYSSQEDLICKYSFNDYAPQEGDRVAIFKLGWTLVKEYVLFEWAPADSNAKVHHVVFNKHVLPKNYTDLYQVCYISGENELHGASSSFQFTVEPLRNSYKSMMQSSVMQQSKSSISDETPDQQCLEELEKLRDENIILKATIKTLIDIKSDPRGGFVEPKNYDEDIKELRETTENLQTIMNRQQLEMNMLKTKIIECGEEYKKLYLEKLKLEKKLQKEKSEKSKDVAFNKEVVNKEVNCFRSITSENNFDISNLPSMPPCPIRK